MFKNKPKKQKLKIKIKTRHIHRLSLLVGQNMIGSALYWSLIQIVIMDVMFKWYDIIKYIIK